jgi:geranylgeranyl diphosphate synthase type II
LGLADELLTRKKPIDAALERLLPAPTGPARSVCEAMRYAVLGDGKRLRPILVVASCEACGGDPRDGVNAGAALELIHAYSLIHDDLPMMDDDDLRRGRPTTHRAFGEATALLAGDALQALAFEILATHPTGSTDRRSEAVQVVSSAAGAAGMVGGQVADLEAEQVGVAPDHLRWIHVHKTAALFAASAEVGAIHAAATPEQRAALKRYGSTLGLAFQITDDILDCTASTARLGKTAGKDARASKSTYPALFGLDDSRRAAREMSAQAVAELQALPRAHGFLAELAEFAVTRAH